MEKKRYTFVNFVCKCSTCTLLYKHLHTCTCMYSYSLLWYICPVSTCYVLKLYVHFPPSCLLLYVIDSLRYGVTISTLLLDIEWSLSTTWRQILKVSTYACIYKYSTILYTVSRQYNAGQLHTCAYTLCTNAYGVNIICFYIDMFPWSDRILEFLYRFRNIMNSNRYLYFTVCTCIWYIQYSVKKSNRLTQ